MPIRPHHEPHAGAPTTRGTLTRVQSTRESRSASSARGALAPRVECPNFFDGGRWWFSAAPTTQQAEAICSQGMLHDHTVPFRTSNPTLSEYGLSVPARQAGARSPLSPPPAPVGTGADAIRGDVLRRRADAYWRVTYHRATALHTQPVGVVLRVLHLQPHLTAPRASAPDA